MKARKPRIKIPTHPKLDIARLLGGSMDERYVASCESILIHRAVALHENALPSSKLNDAIKDLEALQVQVDGAKWGSAISIAFKLGQLIGAHPGAVFEAAAEPEPAFLKGLQARNEAARMLEELAQHSAKLIWREDKTKALNSYDAVCSRVRAALVEALELFRKECSNDDRGAEVYIYARKLLPKDDEKGRGRIKRWIKPVAPLYVKKQGRRAST